MEHGGDAFTLWASKRDLTVEINRILYQLIVGVSFFWWLFHNGEYRPTINYFANVLLHTYNSDRKNCQPFAGHVYLTYFRNTFLEKKIL